MCIPHLIHAARVQPSHIANCIFIGSVVLHRLQQMVHILYNALPPYLVKIAPLHGDLDPHLTGGFLDTPYTAAQITSPAVQPFLHSSWQRVILYNGPTLAPSKLPLCTEDLEFGPHLIHGSLGPPKSTTQMASRLVQPLLRALDCD